MKKFGLFLLVLFLVNPVFSYAKEATIPVFDNTENNQSQLPRNFRDLSSLGINAIASAQFSATQLQEVKKLYPKDKIIVIDLRQENHGFINNEAVSWHSIFEMANNNKTVSQIKIDEASTLNFAKKNGEFVVNKVLERNRERGWYNSIYPQVVTVKSATSEEELVKQQGFSYKRFPIRDFDIPDKKQLNEMISFIKSLPQDEKIYVHCAGGKGRTGMFLIIVDILQNSKTTTLDKIFTRQHNLGAAELNKISEEEAWTNDIAEKRVEMLKALYQKQK